MSSVVQYEATAAGVSVKWPPPPWEGPRGQHEVLPLPSVLPASVTDLVVALKRLPGWDQHFECLAREASGPWFAGTWTGAGGSGLTAALEAAEASWAEIDPEAEHPGGFPPGFERHFDKLLAARCSAEFSMLASVCRRILEPSDSVSGPDHSGLPPAVTTALALSESTAAPLFAGGLAVELASRARRQFLTRALEATLHLGLAVEFELPTPYGGPLVLEEVHPTAQRGSRRFRPDASMRALVSLLRLTPGDLSRAAKATDGSLSEAWSAELGCGTTSTDEPVISAEELYGFLSRLPGHPQGAYRHAAKLVARIPLRDILCFDPRPGHATARLFGGGLALIAMGEFATSSMRGLPPFAGVTLPPGSSWRLSDGEDWNGADSPRGRLVVTAREGLSAGLLGEATPEPLTELCVEYGRFPLPPAGQRAGEVRAMAALQASGRSSLARALERELQAAGEQWAQRLRILRRYVRLRQRVVPESRSGAPPACG